ncbi:hypothetical protein BpHYR1_019225 [Brachionus plicatilis]|uniref:Uncharacterized protein n=1 Tax=Brachionus plicatilis TaxID=10195 RepID=A0A3M7QHI9_BRAPC|nr:hypothetical protein BpHYR1_019225 [Brachionus plicatilis]
MIKHTNACILFKKWLAKLFVLSVVPDRAFVGQSPAILVHADQRHIIVIVIGKTYVFGTEAKHDRGAEQWLSHRELKIKAAKCHWHVQAGCSSPFGLESVKKENCFRVWQNGCELGLGFSVPLGLHLNSTLSLKIKFFRDTIEISLDVATNEHANRQTIVKQLDYLKKINIYSGDLKQPHRCEKYEFYEKIHNKIQIYIISYSRLTAEQCYI